MIILKLTNEEYKVAQETIDNLLNKGIGELVLYSDDAQESRIVEPMILKTGGRDYEVVELEKDGVSTLFFVHELVAEAWVPNPENMPYIRHKNGNTLDNQADNLEWTIDRQGY